MYLYLFVNFSSKTQIQSLTEKKMRIYLLSVFPVTRCNARLYLQENTRKVEHVLHTISK